jgi:hypothetical protein
MMKSPPSTYYSTATTLVIFAESHSIEIAVDSTKPRKLQQVGVAGAHGTPPEASSQGWRRFERR